MRYLRVIARRVNVPDDCLKHVEAFAGLLPARDAVPCRREQLPAFMQRLYELKMDDAAYNDSLFIYVSLKSGHAGGAEVWKDPPATSSLFTLDCTPSEAGAAISRVPDIVGHGIWATLVTWMAEDCLDECELRRLPATRRFFTANIARTVNITLIATPKRSRGLKSGRGTSTSSPSTRGRRGRASRTLRGRTPGTRGRTPTPNRTRSRVGL